MAQTRREENKHRTSEEILRASRRLFREKGFESVTLDEIAKKAGISRATLYNYFPGKDSLLLGILRAEHALIRAMLSGELRGAGAEARLRQTVEVLVLDAISYLALTRKLLYLNSLEDNFLHPTRAELTQIFAGLVEECKAEGVFRSVIPTDEIVDLVMSVHLMVQFGWPGIGQWAPEACKDKANAMLNRVLSDVWLERR
ncbi:MAG: TetR/AcrR family transcriptional regulator [Christensenellaceae bacterium]|jgi:AcrR family transcriptional regulator|nr:TetR/AcrR family transcriptional regulator [Christensenellaceae bacterium]